MFVFSNSHGLLIIESLGTRTVTDVFKRATKTSLNGQRIESLGYGKFYFGRCTNEVNRSLINFNSLFPIYINSCSIPNFLSQVISPRPSSLPFPSSTSTVSNMTNLVRLTKVVISWLWRQCFGVTMTLLPPKSQSRDSTNALGREELSICSFTRCGSILANYLGYIHLPFLLYTNPFFLSLHFI